MSLPHQVAEVPEGPEVPVRVAVEQVLLLVHGEVTGRAIWRVNQLAWVPEALPAPAPGSPRPVPRRPFSAFRVRNLGARARPSSPRPTERDAP